MPSHYENRDIFEAAENDDDESVKKFVEKEHVPVTTTNILGLTVAHIAASHGRLNLCKYLVEKDASLVEMEDRWNQTALHLATKRGAVDVVKYLVDTCNASTRPLSDIFQCNTVVHVAAENGHLRVLQYFIEHKRMEVNVRNSEGQPPVFLAAANDHVHIVEYLMDEANADITMVDNELRNILFMCVEYGYRHVAKFLLDQRHLPFDLNARDIMGRSVLYSACARGNIKFVKYLVEKKHADLNQANNDGWTPLHQAANMSDWKLVEYIVQHGADPQIKDLQDRTALDLSTNKQVTECLNQARQNRTRRNAMEWFNPVSQRQDFMDTDRIGSSSLKPNWCDIHFGLILANIFVRLFKRSDNSHQPFQSDSFSSKSDSSLRSRIDIIAADIVHSISSEKFTTNSAIE